MTLEASAREALRAGAKRLLTDGDFVRCAAVLDAWDALNGPCVESLIYRAVCLAELGAPEMAANVLGSVREAIAHDPEARTAFAPLLAFVERWLPGGRFSAEIDAQLQSDAARFRPRLR
jgi:hypothetical protein